MATFRTLVLDPIRITGANAAGAKVFVSYDRPVRLKSGGFAPRLMEEPVAIQDGTTATVQVIASDDPDLTDDSTGFGILVSLVWDSARDYRPQSPQSYTAQVSTTMADPIRLSKVMGALPTPPQYADAATLIAAANSAKTSAMSAAASAAASAALVGAPAGTAIDAHLGGDATGLVASVNEKVNKDAIILDASNHGVSATNTAPTNTEALADALDGLSTGGGGTILLPPGDIHLTNMTLPTLTTLRGRNGGTSQNTDATRLIFSPTSGPGISIGGTGWSMESLTALADDAMTGSLVARSGPGVAFGSVRDCHFGSVTEVQTSYALDCIFDLYGTQAIEFDNCRFYGATDLIRALVAGDASSSNFSNQIAFRSCTFNRYTGYIARNPGRAWVFDNCAFEADVTQVGHALIVEDGAEANSGVLLSGCWGGDNHSGGDWITWRGHSLSIVGGFWGLISGGLVSLPENADGVTITGVNAFANSTDCYLVDATAATGSSVVVLGNRKGSNGTVFKNNVVPSGAIWGDDTIKGLGVGGQIFPADGTLAAPSIKFSSGAGLYGMPAGFRVVDGSAHVLADYNTSQVRLYATKLGFYGASAVTQPTVPAAGTVTADDLRAALVSLGLVQ